MYIMAFNEAVVWQKGLGLHGLWDEGVDSIYGGRALVTSTLQISTS